MGHMNFMRSWRTAKLNMQGILVTYLLKTFHPAHLSLIFQRGKGKVGSTCIGTWWHSEKNEDTGAMEKNEQSILLHGMTGKHWKKQCDF